MPILLWISSFQQGSHFLRNTEVHLLIHLIQPGISMVICWTLLEHKQRDLVVVGFTPSINSWEIVQLIKLITTQLLPAAGLFPFVFTQSNGVKEVDESCRYVWLAVWISGIRYPEVFPPPLYNHPSLEKLKEGEKFWKNISLEGKITHCAISSEGGGWLVREQVFTSFSSAWARFLHSGFCIFQMNCAWQQ